MAPTAAMLMLSHNTKTHNHSSLIIQPSSPSATPYFWLKSQPLRMVAKFNPISKQDLDNNQIQTCSVVDPSSLDKKRFEEVLQLCSC
ncbi:hypothetical protein Lalb_Chr16g0383171 [Lupinus albus]|uniref:Uncharacterized protein n=1 Tax=Lupinus albus TaxID=3870 RepID=A0A6A4P6E1_LUPAL|nr:hypothetical protein Lalb_Chr16g0383171 [Lupinus albus]